MSDIQKYVVLVAGGKGTRMGAAMPKQFLLLKGKPVLTYSILAFMDAIPDINIVIVLPPDQLSYAQIILQSLPFRIDATIVPGGETRFHSVQNGLNAIHNDGVVFIHDGARPLISKALINKCLSSAIENGSAIPAIPVAESMRILTEGSSNPVDRDHLRIIQTPQTFLTSVILPAFCRQWQASFTDEATVLEASGIPAHLVEGEKRNIKITTPEDFVIAEALLEDDHA